jgi:hypothetical protein
MVPLKKTLGLDSGGGMDGVYQSDKDSINMPFYRLSSQPFRDRSVVIQHAGHWNLSLHD